MIWIILHHHNKGIAAWPMIASERPDPKTLHIPDFDAGFGERIEIQGPFELEQK